MTAALFLRRVRRVLAGWPRPAVTTAATPADGVLRAHTRRFVAAQALVHAFYAFLLYQAVVQLGQVAYLAEHTPFQPLWPVRWLPHGTRAAAASIRALCFFYLGTNALAAVLPGWRTVRALAFVGLLEYVALVNSYGKIGHSLHLPLLVSLLLIFLPRGWHRSAPRTTRTVRQGTLLVFWLGGAAVLLSYTMSGLGKFGYALYQLAAGQPNAFGPGGLSAIVAQRLLETHSQSLLGAWIINHPRLTWPALPFAIYLELFSVVVAFRPALARPWAAVLIVFHLANVFVLTINFSPSCFLLALFFLRSPFDPGSGAGWRERLFAVPLAGDALKLLQSRPRRPDETYTAGAAPLAGDRSPSKP